MSETGFGSLSFNPLPEYNDAGFGSPTRSLYDGVEVSIGDARDTGFGSPYDNYRYPIELRGEFASVPDDGGTLIKLVTKWWELWDNTIPPKHTLRDAELGPFYVDFISVDTGTRYRGIGDTKRKCFTNFSMDTLYVGVPVLPRGAYNLEINWQVINTIIIRDALTIKCRPRIKEAYNIRKHVPHVLKRGPHILRNDPIGIYKGESHLSALLKSVAERIQDLSGRPSTGLASSLTWGASTINVESTIGFPDSGTLIIDGHKVKYTSKTDNSFDGINYLKSYWSGHYTIKEEVSCDVTTA